MRIYLLKLCFFLLISLQLSLVCAQIPAGYYDPATGLTGKDLQQKLHDIIDNHTVIDYSLLPVCFQSTDDKQDGTVWDMYSDIPGGTPAYIYHFNEDECGNYSKEGDCFNREHSFPKSWFGGEQYPMYSDLFHLYPTDGWVNNKRSNYPFGETNNPSWTSTNGSKLGPSSYPGYTDIIFEPIDEYKGDFARSILYMAVRYYGEDAAWPGSGMVSGSEPVGWALKMLIGWNDNDPVSQKESERNEAVFDLQGNRNPFIDNSSFVEQIWGTQTGIEKAQSESMEIIVWPLPAKEFLYIELGDTFQGSQFRIFDVTGNNVMSGIAAGTSFRIDLPPMKSGYYILSLSDNERTISTGIIVSH